MAKRNFLSESRIRIWRLVFDPPFPSPIRDLPEKIRQALESPVSGPSFSRQIGKGKKVVLLIDNFARLTPASRILPPILDTIQKAGARAEILVASGGLREMNEAELKRKLGRRNPPKRNPHHPKPLQGFLGL